MSEENKTESPIEFFTVDLKSVNALYKVYMPFIQNGGIFIPSEKKSFQLGDRVQVELHLPTEVESEIHSFEGTVVWITPTTAQGRWSHGMGVEFPANEKNRRLREKINVLLAENLNEAATSTM